MAPIHPLPAPPLSIPTSPSLVTVQALDTTLQLYVRSENFLNSVLPGHEVYNCPAIAFLITDQTSGRTILFDAGARKDYWNYSPLVAGRFEKGVNVKGLRVEKGVHEVLEDTGVKLEGIEAVVWSHWHFDHIGDVSQFPSLSKIIVGPGFKDNLLPGYPSNPSSPLLESDYANHELVEISFNPSFKIGQFNAYDYFGNGSFYLLDVPGHAIGHICSLARTTEDTFMLLGAESCHFAGALRPSPYISLPESLDTNTTGMDAHFPNPCPCSLFTDFHPCFSSSEEKKRTTPYYTASKAPGSAYVDREMADWSIGVLKEFDADPNVMVCLAHDPALFEVLPLLNQGKGKSVNDWKKRGWKEDVKWRFLNELPRNGMPGRKPIVSGFWRDGKQVSVKRGNEQIRLRFESL